MTVESTMINDCRAYWRDGVRILSAEDTSPTHDLRLCADYDPGCARCRLGYGHSTEYHIHAVIRARGS